MGAPVGSGPVMVGYKHEPQSALIMGVIEVGLFLAIENAFWSVRDDIVAVSAVAVDSNSESVMVPIGGSGGKTIEVALTNTS